MHVEIREMPERRVGTVRHVGPYDRIGQAFARLGAIAGPAGLLQAPESAMIAIYHDDPEATPPDQLRSDAGIAVPEHATLPASLVEQRLVAGRYASTVHVGGYDRLGDTWMRLMGEWLPASGHRMAPGVSYELYLNTPMTAPEERLETAIFIPIE
jgi:AraC family transcriptional regulator